MASTIISEPSVNETVEAMISRVRPTIEDHRADGEVERDLPQTIYDALREAGVFSFWTPSAYGGRESGFVEGLRLFEGLSALDPSTGWVVGNALSVVVYGRGRDAAVSEEQFRDPSATFAGAVFPPGTAVRTKGGFRITAQWSFNSGCTKADWIVGVAALTEGGEPSLGENGAPRMVQVTLPQSQAEIVDTWNTLGMRGTGSHDVRLVDHFVPDGWARIADPAAPANPVFFPHRSIGSGSS